MPDGALPRVCLAGAGRRRGRSRCLSATMLLLVVLQATATAAPPPGQAVPPLPADPAPAEERPEEAAGAPGPLRNPFAPSARVLGLSGKSALTGNADFRPNPGAMRLPKLKLRGLVQGKSKGGIVALLEVEKVGVYLVQIGDIIGLPGGSNETVLKVREITELSLIVEVGSLGQLIIIR